MDAAHRCLTAILHTHTTHTHSSAYGMTFRDSRHMSTRQLQSSLAIGTYDYDESNYDFKNGQNHPSHNNGVDAFTDFLTTSTSGGARRWCECSYHVYLRSLLCVAP
jgi:hypothetical protein